MIDKHYKRSKQATGKIILVLLVYCIEKIKKLMLENLNVLQKKTLYPGKYLIRYVNPQY